MTHLPPSSRFSRWTRGAGVFSLFWLAATIGNSCKSGLQIPPSRDAGGEFGLTAGATGGVGSSGSGGSGGGAVPLPDAGGCIGIQIPEFDCPFGTPEVFCATQGTSAFWDFTCPESPHDASPSPWEAGSTGGSAATGGIGPGSGGSAGTTTGAGGDVAFDGGGSPDAPSDCAAIAASIASETQLSGTCTAVVRLDYATLRNIAHTFVCGTYRSIDEATARKTASPDGFFVNSTNLSGSSPEDEWVFLVSPSDFGGAAAVSARSGIAVFVGSIVSAGRGDITIPSRWYTSDLGSGCASPASVPVRSFDLSGGQATARMREAADTVLGTALPSAFGQWGHVFDVVVLLYPRAVGMFDPSHAEYIVLVNAGWLE